MLKKHIISSKTTVKQVLSVINILKKKILFVCNNRKLLGTITDGDIRRFIIKKNFKDYLNFQAQDLMNQKPFFILENKENKKIPKNIKFLPLLNSKKEVIDIYENRTFINNSGIKKAIILAGGQGKRLRPITFEIPKPLVEINNQPNLLRLLNFLQNEGVKEVVICAKYMIDKIKNFLNNYDFKMKIILKNEKKFLDTAGPLGNLTTSSNEDYLVLNSDLVFNINLNELHNFHKKNNSLFTICAKTKKYQISYGVLLNNKNILKKIIEKPTQSFLFNAGIYLINSKILKKIKKNKSLSMSEFINGLLNKGQKIKIFYLHEDWYDIASLEDLRYINQKIND